MINLEILKTINNKREVIDINLNNNYNLTLDILLDNTLKLMGKEFFLDIVHIITIVKHLYQIY